ncbi:MAG: hypothetical protein OXU23_11485 [Candidatus Poribacteria bacterium]|nr:hypothetical protein [Candidatus Poribacteria bacterium]
MGYYAIGIGGTGAKCLESLIHLAAAGMMPEKKEELYVLFVDPDKANGCLERAVKTLECYKIFSNNPQLAQPYLLQTKIDSEITPIFSPFDNGDDDKPRLEEFFGHAGLRLANDGAADLFEVLYSEKERTTQLHEGFRGHPSIGAAVMAQTVLGGTGPWKTFQAKVAKDPDAKIFLAGSIFGGTGASGFPTIAKLIKSGLQANPIEVQIGGALILPYFTFIDNSGAQLKAKAEHFLMNTQAALEYYQRWNKDLVYNAIYLIGDDSQVQLQNFSLGGKAQQNAQHFIELYAALAAIHFFGKGGAGDGGPQYFRLDRANKPFNWVDLPDGNGGVKIQSRLRSLYHFSVAYLQVYKPMLDDIAKGQVSGYEAPWHIDFFERNQPNRISLNDIKTQGSLNEIKNYCEDFLVWLANVQHSKDDDGKFAPIVDFNLTNVINRISSDNAMQRLEAKGLSSVWRNMCSAKRKGEGTDIGKFLSALYQNCEKI